jgi:hypothetical protein
MPANHFEYLSGTITVNADAPEDWQPRRSIITGQLYSDKLPFWSDPNNDAWGVQFCRVLYHESLHFWLCLSSAYIASLVAAEWDRLLHYEATGVLQPPGDLVRDHSITRAPNPFSVAELVECWARYWDVHTRGPAKIIHEEGIPVDDPATLRRQYGSFSTYTGVAFDTVMQVGEDCAIYGRPYRWLLERVGSRAAALIFPIIAHAAFSTPRPVEMFCRCATERPSSIGDEAARLRAAKLDQFMNEATGVVNLDWLRGYGLLVDALVRPWAELIEAPERAWLQGYGLIVDTFVRPFSEGMEIPVVPNGLSLIQTSSLKTHPIFSEYPSGFSTRVQAFLDLHTTAIMSPDNPHAEAYLETSVGFARVSPMILLALPGQPCYRFILGNLVPPPRIIFRNMTWYAMRPALLRFQPLRAGEELEETYEYRSETLAERVKRFRAAEKAVSLGLPPNAFEDSSTN